MNELTEQQKLYLCLLAGCKIETDWKNNVMTMRTANPCAVMKMPDGRFQVVEYRGE